MTSGDVQINIHGVHIGGPVTVIGGVLRDTYKGRALIEFPDRTESWVPLNRVSQINDEPPPDAVVEVRLSQGPTRRYFRRGQEPSNARWWEIGTARWYSWAEVRGFGSWCELERSTPSGNYTDKL